MIKLNLPSFEYALAREGSKVSIFDSIRKKYVILTPEEWVRQHVVNYLVVHRNYPRSLIHIEGGVRYNTLAKRSDLVVYNREGRPWMIIECKAPQVAVDNKTVAQASMYNSTLQAGFLVVTNGLIHHCFNINWTSRQTIRLDDFPDFPGMDRKKTT